MQLSVIKYIREFDEDIPRQQIVTHFTNMDIPRDTVHQALRDLENISNIGHWWNAKQKCAYVRWYAPNSLTNHVQECLDRGDNW